MTRGEEWLRCISLVQGAPPQRSDNTTVELDARTAVHVGMECTVALLSLRLMSLCFQLYPVFCVVFRSVRDLSPGNPLGCEDQVSGH